MILRASRSEAADMAREALRVICIVNDLRHDLRGQHDLRLGFVKMQMCDLLTELAKMQERSTALGGRGSLAVPAEIMQTGARSIASLLDTHSRCNTLHQARCGREDNSRINQICTHGRIRSIDASAPEQMRGEAPIQGHLSASRLALNPPLAYFRTHACWEDQPLQLLEMFTKRHSH